MTRHRISLASTTLITLLIFMGNGASADHRLLSWHPAGYGGGGRFTAIAVDPVNPKIIYVGSDVAGIFKSRDGGNHYEIKGKGLESFGVADIAVSPADSSQVFALLDGGLHHSVNQGESWVRISSEIRYPSRFFGSKLLLFHQNSLWIGTDAKGVYRIPQKGVKSSPECVVGLESSKINGLTLHSGFLYAGTSRGVYRLQGQSWISETNGFPSDSVEIVDIASSRQVLYALEKRSGLYRWNERALMWEGRPVSLKPSPKEMKSLFVHPDNPDVVFIGSHPENWPYLLCKTQDGGKTWKLIESFQLDPDAIPNAVRSFTGLEKIAFVPGSTQTLFMADWWNIWRTTDTGDHWLQKHHGLQNTVINDIKVHPRDLKILYLCASDNGLMVSEDSGKNWRRLMNGVADGHAQEMEISKKDPSRMVLLMNPWFKKKEKTYVYESRDAGRSWKDIGFKVPSGSLPKKGYIDGLATNIELDTLSDDTIYVGTNGYGVYKTVNAGKEWFQINEGLTTPYLKGPGALQIHPRSSRILFASTQSGGIYRSSNGGHSWQRVTTGDRFTFGLAIDSSKPSRILSGCGGKTLLLSNDDGTSWQEIQLPVAASPHMAVFSVAFHPDRPGLALAGTIRYDVKATEGLFISRDGARTFRQAPMDIPKLNINTISLTTGYPDTGFIGFNGTGIFRLRLGDRS